MERRTMRKDGETTARKTDQAVLQTGKSGSAQ